MSHDFTQFCYVTNDVDQAIDQIRQMHAMGPFREMREMQLPLGAEREIVAHFALAFKGDVQYEIVQPLSGDTELYQQLLSDSDGFQMLFHHIGQHISNEASYKETLNRARQQWPIPVEMAVMGGYFSYADARQTVGHHLEFFCFPNDTAAIEAPRY